MSTWATFGLIALGGAAGSVARAAVALAVPSRFPWATLVVNVAGSFLIGWLMARGGGLDDAAVLRSRALLVTGFCGGFTTFSTFSWQTIELMQRGAWAAAAANVALSVGLCLAGVGLGVYLGRP
jgi:CrcB protein